MDWLNLFFSILRMAKKQCVLEQWQTGTGRLWPGIRVKIQGIETFCFFSELDFVFLSLEAHEYGVVHILSNL